MARFYGEIGYALTEEVRQGIWEERIHYRPYFGSVERNTRRYENGVSVNDDLTLNNQISIIADAYAYESYFAIRTIKWNGAHWKVTNVEIQRPRILLTIGGIYNGATE